ncbi:hypothetical protein ABG067_000055 [Albugo candida]
MASVIDCGKIVYDPSCCIITTQYRSTLEHGIIMKKDMGIDSGEVFGQWSAMNGVEVSRAIAVRDISVLGLEGD